ncbi:undecaprenyl-diphosphatase [Saccharopolyspora kobensis]|uniref:Undecaprenyl-diphosphatase n=1 Tax=Saccharopolyspora kobensis TaxID=146035 RepID=A0A1H5T6Y8_9PSEU|nr:bifunctional phosphatase PAP2/diacylglycerol kinase family protein [Saccharopolyspora kobensis]SEF58550.1 undecaprenyl-diphosphatase [Saccharopolyspora kobensis]SFC49419.1 undecaprenyl-diphosphatase [Saccharopolyspora kobensis]
MLKALGTARRHVSSADRHLVHRCAGLPKSVVDPGLRQLSRMANHSKLWFALAGALAVRKGPTRRAALRGVAAISATSAVTNLLAKQLLPRRRPASDLLPMHRRLVHRPVSSSFPSGHAASAAAFATAACMESPLLGAAVVPIAAAVAYSRVHVGVHWPTDVAFGAAIGCTIGLATRRWWPVRPAAPGLARPSEHVAALTDGNGLALLVNTSSGDRDPSAVLTDLWPAAKVLHPDPGADIVEQLHRELDEAGDSVRALAVAGGDGTVAAAASAAAVRGLPLAVIPAGTLNHFARDLGVTSAQDADRALAAGSAVQVDLGAVGVDDRPVQWFVNTASLGGYPDMVRLREKWEPLWGKWPAAAAALLRILAEAEPIEVRIDGAHRKIWLLFAGANGYQPKGFAPTWRPRLDDGVLDIRYVRADLPLSRTRFAFAALTGALFNSRTYVQLERESVRVEVLGEPVALACDGEVIPPGRTFSFASRDEALRVYRPENAG